MVLYMGNIHRQTVIEIQGPNYNCQAKIMKYMNQPYVHLCYVNRRIDVTDRFLL